MLWVDKYRPKRLDQLTYHDKLTKMLRKMIISGNFPHLLFYGPPGAGKKTRILALMQEVYGKGVTKIKTEHRTFKVNSKTIEITTLGSNYHIEMNPSDAGIYDRVVVQDIIKEIASSASLVSAAQQFKAQQRNKNNNENNINNSKTKKSTRWKRPHFKVVILNEVDKLTKDAQHGLRRTMEKYMSTCRIILQCNAVSKVIEPLQSRCLSIRIAAPSHETICNIMKEIAMKERVTINDEFAKTIAMKSGRNLRRAMLMLQVSCTESNQLIIDANSHNQSGYAKIRRAPWQLFIDELARIIVEEQSPQRLLLARQKIYELLGNCIPSDVIFVRLTIALMENVDDSLRKDIAEIAAYHEHRMQLGAKPIIHLEAFLARFMFIYKKWQASFFG